MALERSHVVRVQLLDQPSVIRNLGKLFTHEPGKNWFYGFIGNVVEIVHLSQQLLIETIKAGTLESQELCAVYDVTISHFNEPESQTRWNSISHPAVQLR